ncbi:MAG: DUF1553 domain-containing protein [Candidatus Hydrogenedens sp.]|nr:DUF1553 domain-containing protein [Candidatus Hydrogenedens sp.]
MLCLSAAAAPDTVSYNRDIRPVLSDKCFTCHGPDKKSRKAGLRLDIEADAKAALRSGETALIPGDRAASALYARITASDPSDRMPPPGNGHELSAEQIETFGRWIDGGAEYEDHWAFVPPVKAAVPEVSNAAWPQNAIDRFVLARLEREGIAPSPEADKRTLLRRLSLDLTGLPPTPEEQERFLADESPFAYEKTVDRLLESPRFGERWARHWLDAARYADSNGYSIDSPREIWPYRDYVINAFNSDKPFDQFVLEQMAGDQLPEATREQHVATGFHRNTMINEEGGVDVEEFRVEAVLDRVNTVGTVFLGLTLGCARCHDHKYDPVSQQEYFSLFAYLNNDAEETLQLPTPEQEQAIAEAKPEAAALRKELADYIAGSSDEQRRFEDKLPLRRLRDLSPEEQTALLKSPENRTEAEQTTALEVFKRMDRTASSLLSKISVLDKVSEGLDTTMVLASLQGGRESHLLIQGSYGSNGEVVEPGVIAALHVPGERGGRRLDLADWLVDPANPLLTRVTVNRFWQRLFGKGIVETESDFGLQGSLPTHPELLDWLAVDFREQGWSIKYAIKQMVMSATYRQSSRPRPDLKEMDPVNTLLARQNRMRLDAEIIRDSALAAAGVLDERIGGPSVYPPQPEGVTNLGQRARDWPVNKDEDRFRRGLYTAIWRATPYYALNVFDAPNGQEACTRRVRSNTPLQSLTLLNDPSYVELAQELAARLMRGDGTPEARIQEAFRLCLGRHPTARESDLLLDLFARQREALTGERAAEVYPKETGDPAEAAAWTMVARAMFNLDEFVTRE